MKKFLIIIIFYFILCGCSNASEKDNITKLMKENEYIIIDVRTKEEYEESHVEEAINIPYDEIDETINIDKTKIIFIYCKSGSRSSVAYNTLTNLGYTVYDLGAYSEVELPKSN